MTVEQLEKYLLNSEGLMDQTDSMFAEIDDKLRAFLRIRTSLLQKAYVAKNVSTMKWSMLIIILLFVRIRSIMSYKHYSTLKFQFYKLTAKTYTNKIVFNSFVLIS